MTAPVIRLVTTGKRLSADLARSLEVPPALRSEFAALKRDWPNAEVRLPWELPTEAELGFVHAALDIACRGPVWA